MDNARTDRLLNFTRWVSENIRGDEKGEAQIFLDRLFQAFGQRGCLEVGGQPEMRVRRAGEDGGGTAFADFVWKPVVLIEMKRRGADLSKHYRQAFDYWTRLVPGRPRYAVLCNFDEFWIYDFETQMDAPVDKVTLADLPERYGPLAFLLVTNDKPVFGNDHEAVTRKAADLLARCFNKLLIRKVPRDDAQRFTLQMLVALFAEDIGLLERYTVTNLIEECKKPSDSYDLLGGLFEAMNTPGGISGGRFKGVRYFNGGLFNHPVRMELHDDELNQIKEAARSDWSKVRPEIFGTLFEHSLGQEERHAFGAHFTHPADIMKIVGPTIVEPWREQIEGARTQKRLGELLRRMQHYTVADLACGSGNFLYIAYREIKRLEARALERTAELSRKGQGAQPSLGFVTAANFFGMDINPFAVELAKVTMMIARKLAIDELHSTESPLPLDNLDANFIAGDALIDAQGRPVEWPKVDVIIGNPPFLGAKRLKPERGADYVNAVRRAYPEVPGMADYCVYWFRKTHEHLPPCTPEDPVTGRAGLVGTQNIRNNQSRVGGLDFIVKDGTIIEAVDNQPWSGEANVHVSIANWAKTQDPNLLPKARRLWSKADGAGAGGAASPQSPSIVIPGTLRGETPTRDPVSEVPRSPHGMTAVSEVQACPEGTFEAFRSQGSPHGMTARQERPSPPKRPAGRGKDFELAYRDCAFINSALSDETDVSGARVLKCNTEPQRCFTGQMIGHDSFLLDRKQRLALLQKSKENADVLFPYLNGREFLAGDGGLDRFVIDFGMRDQLHAAGYAAAFELVKQNVLPDRERKAQEGVDADGNLRPHHKQFLSRWWQLSFPRPELISQVEKLKRFVVCSRVTKRPVFVFVASSIRPGDALSCFAFEDDYSFGILQANPHWQWFLHKCSKLTERLRYSPDSVFDTFPWPQAPTVAQIEAVAEAGREIRRIRAEALSYHRTSLRALYRTLELPGKNPLKDAHAALDAAVLSVYGFDPAADLLAQLLALNLQVAQRIEQGQPVTSPGLPPTYPDPAKLITPDCIQPPEEFRAGAAP